MKNKKEIDKKGFLNCIIFIYIIYNITFHILIPLKPGKTVHGQTGVDQIITYKIKIHNLYH